MSPGPRRETAGDPSPAHDPTAWIPSSRAPPEGIPAQSPCLCNVLWSTAKPSQQEPPPSHSSWPSYGAPAYLSAWHYDGNISFRGTSASLSRGRVLPTSQTERPGQPGRAPPWLGANSNDDSRLVFTQRFFLLDSCSWLLFSAVSLRACRSHPCTWHFLSTLYT